MIIEYLFGGFCWLLWIAAIVTFISWGMSFFPRYLLILCRAPWLPQPAASQLCPGHSPHHRHRDPGRLHRVPGLEQRPHHVVDPEDAPHRRHRHSRRPGQASRPLDPRRRKSFFVSLELFKYLIINRATWLRSSTATRSPPTCVSSRSTASASTAASSRASPSPSRARSSRPTPPTTSRATLSSWARCNNSSSSYSVYLKMLFSGSRRARAKASLSARARPR